jgi:hypothetical protein
MLAFTWLTLHATLIYAAAQVVLLQQVKLAQKMPEIFVQVVTKDSIWKTLHVRPMYATVKMEKPPQMQHALKIKEKFALAVPPVST